jgi:death-on-curing protein
MTDYLTRADILAMHEDQIEPYGGSYGLRDAGQLEAALFRSQSGYYADLIEEAVALWESLSQNHPFVDGNKRTAFAATYTFLEINGHTLTADAQKTWQFLKENYASGQMNFDRLFIWLRANTTAR